jgi:hypothetical protein
MTIIEKKKKTKKRGQKYLFNSSDPYSTFPNGVGNNSLYRGTTLLLSLVRVHYRPKYTFFQYSFKYSRIKIGRVYL